MKTKNNVRARHYSPKTMKQIKFLKFISLFIFSCLLFASYQLLHTSLIFAQPMGVINYDDPESEWVTVECGPGETYDSDTNTCQPTIPGTGNSSGNDCPPGTIKIFNNMGIAVGCSYKCGPGETYDSDTNTCQPTIPRGLNPSQGSGGMPHLMTPGSLGEIQGVGGFLPTILTIGSIGEMFETLFSNILGVFTVVAGLMFLIYFVFGALGWITAGGDAEKIQKAQKQITNAVLGLVLVIIAYSIVTIIGSVLGLDILNPAGEIENLGPS